MPILQRLSKFSILNPLSLNSSANPGLRKFPPRAPESKKALALLISFTALIALSFALCPFWFTSIGEGIWISIRGKLIDNLDRW